MNWDVLDILTFTTMVTVVVVVLHTVWRSARSRAYRAASAIAALSAFLLVWVNAAVGIIGNEEDEANLLFFGVLAVAVLGSLFARFRAKGMAVTLYATAGAQILVAVFAIAARLGASSAEWPRGILIISAVFTAFWLFSGWLFKRAAIRERRFFVD